MIADHAQTMMLRGAAFLRTRASARWYHGWTVVAVACLTVSIASGIRAVFGVLLVPLGDAFDWGRAVTAGSLSLNALVWALSAAPLGMLLDRWGPRRLFTSAALVAGLGLALVATTESVWQVYVGIGLLAGLGLTPLIPVSQNVVIAQWFGARRGLAMGIVASGLGLGVLVLAPLTQWAIDQMGWRAGFLLIAVLLVFGIAPLQALVQRQRTDGATGERDGRGAAPAAGTPGGPTVRLALHSPRFWLLALGQLLGNAPQYLLLFHAVAYLGDVGFAPSVAAAVLGLTGACTVGASLLWGYAADHWGLEMTYTAGSAALAATIGALALVAPGREGLLPVLAVLFALGIASRQGLGPLMGAALCRGRSLGALMGILGATTALGVGLGPGLGGWVFDLVGSYQPAFALALASTLAAVVCIWFAAPRRGALRADAGLLPSAASAVAPVAPRPAAIDRL
jgi:MFS family permease